MDSVYRRFYLPNKEAEIHIAGILSRIVDENLSYSVTRLLEDMQPSKAWYWGLANDATYIQRMMAVLISKIRHSEADKFNGLTAPAMFRPAA